MSKKIMFNDRFCLTQAVLDGTKTMTRRIEKPTKMRFNISKRREYTMTDVTEVRECLDDKGWYFGFLKEKERIGYLRPHYQLDEVVAIAQRYAEIPANCFPNAPFSLDAYKEQAGWNNKLFVKADLLPHHIRITDVRMERLQEISYDDIMREGIEYANGGYYVNYNKKTHSRTWLGNNPQKAFSALIDKISGKGTCLRNPWVVVYEFEKVD